MTGIAYYHKDTVVIEIIQPPLQTRFIGKFYRLLAVRNEQISEKIAQHNKCLKWIPQIKLKRQLSITSAVNIVQPLHWQASLVL